MMKMNFSLKSGKLKSGILPALLMLSFLLFSGNSLSAQYSLQSEGLPSDAAMYKVYGDNFVENDQAGAAVKAALETVMSANTSNNQQEAERSVEAYYLVQLLEVLSSDVTVSKALKMAYAKANMRKADYNLYVDLDPIYEKYYALLTN